MDLTCYLHPGWAPLIRPAPATRAWMDATPESFAYRCLPLNIANAHGWELLSPCGFEAVWDGDPTPRGVSVSVDAGADPRRIPVSLFGQGVVTFHVEGIFRTPPGWNLWVGGSPNRPKDGLFPLSGVIETDWSPFTFTMNWRFTRPGAPIRFEALEPFCFLFPVQRDAIEAFQPRLAPMSEDPDLLERFTLWSRDRDAFQERMLRDPPKVASDRWQKYYYRGVDASGEAHVEDHRSKLRLKAFDANATPGIPTAPLTDPPERAAKPGNERESLALRKREWLLETLERQRALATSTIAIERRAGLSPQEFLERYYAVNRPVILKGEMDDWPALQRWTPDYLKAKVGSRIVEFQGERTSDEDFERRKDAHKRSGPFDAFIDRIQKPGAGNDAYITAYNSAANREALSPLDDDLGFLDKFLTREVANPHGMMWIGPAGTKTSLHHDLTNNFIAQIVGRKRLKIAPASEAGKLYNDVHVFSQIADLEDPALDLKRFPRLADVRVYDVTLEPGEIIFMPLAWWHQVTALDFSVTITSTNFRWPNDAHVGYPS
jgi:hypothetical protein